MISSNFTTLLIITNIVFYANSIMFKLVSDTPTCLKIPGGHTYIINYVVSGANDKNVKM